MDLIRAVVKKGLSGLELLAGIPGGVGGALRMNAGAFGQEIEQATLSVSGFRGDGTPFTMPIAAKSTSITGGFRSWKAWSLHPLYFSSQRRMQGL
jgi:UDP-N-acetylenolpyruvoylglucosamine reductase